ncbi:MAG: D-amino acid aminotransferase [Deltaproteobacteria bacterium]|nr:D-amino acid aminotransferase [Deltaproteobacteria bacterium]MCB9478523.1 D-amino acid aminotransferase [Deltaproteobacteria bacterium]
MPELAYVNGEYLPVEKAFVSIDDRGYQFGDGVYEVVFAFDRRPYLLHEHMVRLERSLKGLRIEGVDLAEVDEVFRELAKRGDFPRAKLYLSISRGVHPRDHLFPPKGTKPTVVATVRPIGEADMEMIQRGLTCVTLTDFRWGRCDLKTLNLLGNVLLRQESFEKGADEGILVGSDGVVREGTASNVFAVLDGKAYTHPLNNFILPGITRDLTIRLAEKIGIEVVEETFTLDHMRTAEEIFLTGTIAELVAVTTLDGEAVGDGKPGPIIGRLRDAYYEDVERFIKSGD